MKKGLSFRVAAAAIFLLCIVTATTSSAQVFETLASFNGTNGGYPLGALVQGLDGNLYGTTTGGGANGPSGGTVFRITPTGTLSTLYSFCSQTNCTDGEYPGAGLVQATDGNLYGTTEEGGANSNPIFCAVVGCGTLFKITPAGVLTTLYNFCEQTDCADGKAPREALIQAADGNIYGTTSGGGPYNGGTVFEITPAGTLTILYKFCTQDGLCLDGRYPQGLIQAADGNFYGTTIYGGSRGDGTVFKITPKGALTTLQNFCKCAQGAGPSARLVQASDGNFYGTTAGGGAYRYGTVFKMTPKGALTTIHSFCAPPGCADGRDPQAGLIQATDGNLYGATYDGGVNKYGTLYEITTAGTLTVLHSFDFTDGSYASSGPVQATNGVFYGHSGGGAGNEGTIFTLSVGLSSFVKTLPALGRFGSKVIILGNNLAGTTSVAFNGTAAAFTIVSDTEIAATVPLGATTGTVAVTTPTGTLYSDPAFQVTK